MTPPLSVIAGPILVTGATGFIGSHLLSRLQRERTDVFGAAPRPTNWRATALGLQRVARVSNREQLVELLEVIRPKTVFNLAAHGAYSFQQDRARVIQTNLEDFIALLDWAEANDCAVVQAGSSSEYGLNCSQPAEDAQLIPNSEYALTKAAASQWLSYKVADGKIRGCTLRLYSVYGPLEDPRRLVPTLIRHGIAGSWPPFASRETSRDFVYIDDVVEAFLCAGASPGHDLSTSIVNIASGVATTMEDVAASAREEFGLEGSPAFNGMERSWDLSRWFGDPRHAEIAIGWKPRTTFLQGLHDTRSWYEADGRSQYLRIEEVTPSTLGTDSALSSNIDISVIVACYKDAQAMPIMAERVREVMMHLGLRYELILVNDGSPDDSADVLEQISLRDPAVVGITHSRNFGSQAAFLSGMRMARGAWVALLDGDLQDPPELIADLWNKTQNGYDVVFGRRVDREAPWLMRRAYKAFYRVFQRLAPFEIPRDAGDFSLMSREVVDVILAMPERDLFIRAQRAYVGFRQTGVDYVRPERMFGRSTNNLGRNLGWATRGILAVSRAPLTGLSLFALGMFILSCVLILAQLLSKFLFPEHAPEGLVSISVLVLGLGALNLLAVAIVGEYVGRVLEETKRRPRFVRRSVTRNGFTAPLPTDGFDGEQDAH